MSQPVRQSARGLLLPRLADSRLSTHDLDSGRLGRGLEQQQRRPQYARARWLAIGCL